MYVQSFVPDRFPSQQEIIDMVDDGLANRRFFENICKVNELTQSLATYAYQCPGRRRNVGTSVA